MQELEADCLHRLLWRTKGQSNAITRFKWQINNTSIVSHLAYQRDGKGRQSRFLALGCRADAFVSVVNAARIGELDCFASAAIPKSFFDHHGSSRYDTT